MTSEEAIAKAAVAYLPPSYKRTLRLLEERPSSSEEIARYIGMTVSSAYKLVMVLKSLEVICVVEYRRELATGALIKVWGLGQHDIKRPRKQTPAQRSKAWRQRKKTPDISMGFIKPFG